MVEALFILIVICIAAIVWYWQASRRRMARLEDQSQRRLGELRAEHEKRVGRLERKLGKTREHGHLDFAADLLPALDALGHALEQSARSDQPKSDQPKEEPSDERSDVGALREGLEMVDRELVAILAKHGIQKCNPEPGEPFDPNVHEAVSIEASSQYDDGSVLECFRPGYVHGDRVLRAAAVSVSRATGEDQAETSSSDSPSSADDDTTSSSRV